MKKIFYYFAIISMVFTSCNPLEDIHDDIDAQAAANGIVGDFKRTLSDEDYTALERDFGNFSSEDEVKELLPDFLTEQYPALGVIWNSDGTIESASSVEVTYKLFDPINFEEYTVTDADYTSLGLTSLNDEDDFNDLFGAVFPSEAKGTVVELTYKTEATIEEYTLTDDDYDLVGNNFPNFDIRTGRADETIEARRAKIQEVLLNNFPDAEDGTIYNVTYTAFNNDFENVDLELLVQQQQNEPDASLTTEYTLTDDDFDAVGNGFFNNFDVTPGGPEELEETIRTKIETILLANFPSAAIGDLYNVTYAVWEPGDSTRIMLLEYNGTGYNIFSTTSYEIYTPAITEVTTRFTLTDEWAAPITFTAEEYTIMEQRFPNFGDEDVAEFNIGIYLKTLFPFAKADDFVAVEYDLFDFDAGNTKENLNYTFDGSVWNAIPSVIDAVLQFGHDGETWVPDNTIKYTLTNADFELVGNGTFNNFDVRAGEPDETVEVRREKINTILLTNFPQYGEGQKFSVSYAVWAPGDDVFVLNLIHDGTEYVLQ